MMRTNRSLNWLGIMMDIPPQAWKKQIFLALKENETIRTISLGVSGGLRGEDLFEALVDVLQSTESKTQLETIFLFGTGLESKSAQVDEELRMNTQYRYALRGQKSELATFGRLVMWGYQYAGKTTICEAMKRIDCGTKGDHPFRTRRKRLVQKFPSLARLLFGEHVSLELQKRTRGCDILVLHEQPHLNTIWDFAGQTEYYALHDYLFPQMKNSCFLYVCSCRYPPTYESPKGGIKDENKMREECEYWLKFIASNSKPYYVGQGHKWQLPRVIFVLTKSDTLNRSDARVSKGWAETMVCDLKGTFKDVIDLCDEVLVVNALHQQHVNDLLEKVNDHLGKILKHQTEYNLCQDIRDIFSRWSSENPLKPILDLQAFNKLCKEHFFPDEEVPLGSEEKRQVVLTYFDDIGEIIYLKGLSFIVTNPRWFGVGIMGYLIDAFKGVPVVAYCVVGRQAVDQDRIQSPGIHPAKGIVDRTRMEVLLENSLETIHVQQSDVKAEQLIELIIKLEMYFELEEEKVNSRLFLPALFDDAQDSAAKGEQQLGWKMWPPGSCPTYLGRRLQVENEYATFLSPGFFPRLQVHLRNYCHKEGWTLNPAFKVTRNLIQFSGEGVEVCVEYSGGTDYFVDILVQSQTSYAETLRFVENRVVRTIRRFCASPHGCQGVSLVEGILRPSCVEELHLCKDRKGNSVLVSKLQGELEAKGKGWIHTWTQKLGDANPTDFALDLLDGDGAYEKSTTCQMAPRPEDSRSNGIKELAEAELPKHLYPSIEDVDFLSKLNAALNVCKLLPIKLHILCDYTKLPRKVIGQPGREFQLNWTNGGYQLSIAKVVLSLVWTAVGVATTVAGVPQVGFLHVDKWIEDAFQVNGMATLDAATLHQMNNPGKALEKVSEEDILKALAKYWKIDPHTQDIKEFLQLEDGNGFWKNFLLHKVVYINGPKHNTIGWVCDKHHKEGLHQGRLQSRPH